HTSSNRDWSSDVCSSDLQHYSGHADWDAIAELVSAVDIPVLGNGDIWEAADAVRMVEYTDCAGIVVGRGCLGRPWLFNDLAEALRCRPTEDNTPTLGQVADYIRRHHNLRGASLDG